MHQDLKFYTKKRFNATECIETSCIIHKLIKQDFKTMNKLFNIIKLNFSLAL